MKKALFSLIVSMLLLSGCSGQTAAEPEIPNPAVKVLDLSEKPSYRINEVGQIKAVQEVELIAKASGTIGQISKKVGDPINSGDVLAVIAYDETNNPAQVSYDNAQIQLANAQQNYNQTRANNQDAVTRARLRVESLEASLGRLQRNLEELYVTNESTANTIALQKENAEKNADTAEINYQSVVSQFEQSWKDLLKSTQTTLDSVFISIDSNFSSIEDILNPGRAIFLGANNFPVGMGMRDSAQRTEMVNIYNSLRQDIDEYYDTYASYKPLSDSTVDLALSQAREVTGRMRTFVSAVRTMLYNSVVNVSFPQTTLDAYITQVGTAENVIVADVSKVDSLEDALADFKLSRTTQVATSDNNRIVANNQLADAENAVIQFQTTSAGAVKDMETSIAQTSNDLLSAQADLASAQRSYGISTNAQTLEINSMQNQLRLAEKSLEDNKVVSSINGVLSDFVVDEGDYVSMGTYLGRIIQHEQVKIVFYISKDHAGKLSYGQPFTFKFDDNGSKEYSGIVTKISPTADPQNKKVQIEGAVQNDDLKLRPETFVTLNLDLSAETFDPTKVYVPMNSVIFGQNSQFVYVLEGDQAMRRDIEVGRVYGMWIEVTSGLTKQDIIVVDGHRNLPPTGGVMVQVVQ